MLFLEMMQQYHEDDWRKAKAFFKDIKQAPGQLTKLHRKSRYRHRASDPHIALSLIQLDDQIFRLHPGEAKKEGRIAGRGNFARVKYGDNQKETLTVKIDHAPDSPSENLKK